MLSLKAAPNGHVVDNTCRAARALKRRLPGKFARPLRDAGNNSWPRLEVMRPKLANTANIERQTFQLHLAAT
jgi:hypothetical protein